MGKRGLRPQQLAASSSCGHRTDTGAGDVAGTSEAASLALGTGEGLWPAWSGQESCDSAWPSPLPGKGKCEAVSEAASRPGLPCPCLQEAEGEAGATAGGRI